MDEHLMKTFSDPERETELENCDGLITPADPTEAFDPREPFLREVLHLVKKAPAGSAPGPSNTTYNIYKQ